MNHLTKLLAVAAFAIVAGGASNEAHASFTVRLDNSSNPTGVSWAATANNVGVCVVLDNDPFGLCWPLDDTRPLSSISGSHDFEYTFSETVSNIVSITVTIDGGDSFWIDQIELFNASHVEVWSDGADNEGGWCLSTQPSDGGNANCSSLADDSLTWDEGDGL
jgi:hypothetical protein